MPTASTPAIRPREPEDDRVPEGPGDGIPPNRDVLDDGPVGNGTAEQALSFTDLYGAERLAMVRLAHLITGSNEAAEDLVHEAFLKIRPRFGELRDPGAYLRTTVVNECRMWFRRRDVEARHAPTPSDQLLLPPELDETWATLQQLSPKRRIVVFLRFYEDRSIDDIAEILQCRPGTVRSLLRRGLASLREVLTDGP